MAVEQFISYHAYYLGGLMYGLFFRRFAVPLIVLGFFWHYMFYRLIVGPERSESSEFGFWLPVTLFLGVMMGYAVSALMNLRRVIFWKQFDLYGCWIPWISLQFITFHLIFALWELTGWFVRPVNFIVTLVCFMVVIPLFYFTSHGFTVWAYWDKENGKLSYSDRAALKFYGTYAAFQLTGTLGFTVVEWANSDIWPFWIALGVFVFHILLWFMISMFIVSTNTSAHVQYKKIRAEVTGQLAKVPGAGQAFSFPWHGDGSASSSKAVEMEMSEQQQSLMEQGQGGEYTNNSKGKKLPKLHEVGGKAKQ